MGIAAGLALASAGLWGAADFFGGLASRRAKALAVLLVAQLVGLIPLGIGTFVVHGHPVGIDLAWGAIAGCTGSIGVYFLYRGLAEGQMNVIAPVTAVTAAIVPVIFGLALGEVPGPLSLFGVALAILAIILLGMQEHPSSENADAPTGRVLTARGLGTALTAGLGFGFFYVTLAQTSDAAGLWPLFAARSASCVLFALIPATWAGLREHSVGNASGLKMALGAGSLDAGANIAYLIAIHAGTLTIVPVLSSLYPASTVLLARAVLKERIGRLHWVGLGLTLVAIALIVGG